MVTILLDFKDYIVTDKGDIVAKPHFVLQNIREGTAVDKLPVIITDPYYAYDVCIYNMRKPDDTIVVWNSTEEECPPISSYAYKIPDKYMELDIENHIGILLYDKFNGKVPENYIDRVVLELGMMKARNMENFLRSLIYIVDRFKEHKIIHGIGRGSSCASLILYIIGLHFVDPLLYDIPIEEFLR
jgi:hypothetical protein